MLRITIKKQILLTFFALLLAISAFSQIQISFPLSRMVFQRDNSNNGTIPITGYYQQALDKIEARVVPMQGGTQTGWQTILNNPQGGWYSGSLTVQGGWYQLEVRGVLNGNVVVNNDIQRVGVGEVFLVAGQSNGRGWLNYGAAGAADDRVNCVNYFNGNGSNSGLPQPSFQKLDVNANVSPYGLSAWCWGRLGDLIASRYNVPVMFYNAAWDGTIVKSWKDSKNGGTAVIPWTGGNYPAGQPYGNMRLALNYYASMSGVRAVLWQHGESDNELRTSSANYIADLQAVIAQSRSDYGKNVGWVVARDSYAGPNFGTSSTIINAQNTVIGSTGNVFSGPSTDGIQIPRPDGVHFQNQGLIDAANAWNSALDQGFFNNCAPITGSYPAIVSACSGGNNLNVGVQNMTSVQWSHGVSSSSVSLGPGSYQAQAKDGNGNVYFIPNFNVPNGLTPTSPTITNDGRLQLCQGGSVGLISNIGSSISWSTGATTQRIDVAFAGTYTVTARNAYGCSASSSIAVTNSPLPPPATPTITASGATSFCLGGQVTLTSSPNSGYRWSTGEQGQTITVSSTASYEVKTVDSQGCVSAPARLYIQAYSLPNPPVVSAQGATVFCEGGQVQINSNYSSANIWNTGQTANNITVNKSGTYNVRIRDINGCEAASNDVIVKVNPLPAAPYIDPERVTTFCNGDFTILAASNAFQYNWNTGETTRRINVVNSGSYSLTVTDANGCKSPSSSGLVVKVNPLPAAPVISSSKTPAEVCQGESVTITSNNQNNYAWNSGANTQSVTVNLPGTYSVRWLDANGCYSPFSNTIPIIINPLPTKPVIKALGATTICQGQAVKLESNYGSGNTWSTFESSKQISVSSTGSYSVKVKDAKGCESTSDNTFVTVNSLPSAPRIINETPTTFCQNDNTILAITLSPALFSFAWSTGQNTPKITVGQAGPVTATVTSLSTGCTSSASDAVAVTVNPRPTQPTISANGSTTICADQTVALTANEPTATVYEWLPQQNGKTITVGTEGSYSVRVGNQFGCTSVYSSPTFVKVNALPATPTVVASGITTFCDGDQVNLTVNSPSSVIWNTNETTKAITVKQTGNYAARLKDANGCLSPFSPATKVDVKTLPNTPTIDKVGIFSIEVTNPVGEGIYIWKLENSTLPENRYFIKAKQAGNYQVQATIKYSPTLTCYSKPSASLNYVSDGTISGVGIYPNPVTTGILNIETLEDIKNANIVVYSAAGRLVFSNVVSNFDERKQLDLSVLPPGQYIIEITSGTFRATKKILIENR
jgi:Secretion system C-terminal sorting domain/Carbohydrate esterase, sialic acid-specific acetylesterase